MNLPEKYAWLNNEIGPQMLLEGLKLYGTTEVPGSANNPTIMAWAKEVGVSGWYAGDSVPWCGLFMGVCAKRGGFPYNSELLSSLAWSKWGDEVEKGLEMLGDTLIFTRPGGGHVAFYIGESKNNFLVYGGNESDTTTFEWISKTRLFSARRAHWRIKQPSNVRKVYLSDSGAVLGTNEA